MRKSISIISVIMVMAMFVSFNSFNSIAFAGNSNNTATNPAGNNANVNGKASWKQDQNRHQNRHGWKTKANTCAVENAELQVQVSEVEEYNAILIEENNSLVDENNSLYDQIAELQKKLADAEANGQVAPAVMLGSAPVEEIHPAESRKFAISKQVDGIYGIYTNDFVLSDEAKAKLDKMVPGSYHIEVKVFNIDSGIEVIIETDTEAFEFDKPGREWFIGKTING